MDERLPRLGFLPTADQVAAAADSFYQFTYAEGVVVQATSELFDKVEELFLTPDVLTAEQRGAAKTAAIESYINGSVGTTLEAVDLQTDFCRDILCAFGKYSLKGACIRADVLPFLLAMLLHRKCVRSGQDRWTRLDAM